jgi:hypothetical protein
MSVAVARVSAEPGEAPVQRGSTTLMTQEFRAAVAEAQMLNNAEMYKTRWSRRL